MSNEQQKSPLKRFVSPFVFVAETMVYGLKETFNFKKNWIVSQHDRQHGLDDGRSESAYIASGVTEALATGDLLTATGRFLALFPDVLHSVNLVRHSEGMDLMKNEPIKIELPQFAKDRLTGKTDVQSLSFEFTKNSSGLEKAIEVFTNQYNRWLLINRAFNFKMFPNGAGRLAEMATGLGLTAVGTALMARNGGTFDDVRGAMEFAIGATSLIAGGVDIFITESEEDTVDLVSHDEFIQIKSDPNESPGVSLAKALPRYVMRGAAHLHNDNKVLEKFAEIQDNPELLKAFKDDEALMILLKAAEARQEKHSSLTNTFRSVAGSVVADFKELSDHFGAVLEKMKANDNKMGVLMADLKSAPARYAGAVQLAGAQLLLPLAAYTAVGGTVYGGTPIEKAGFVASGLLMTASWFFKHRGCAAKTRMSLRGITVGDETLAPANDNTPEIEVVTPEQQQEYKPPRLG